MPRNTRVYEHDETLKSTPTMYNLVCVCTYRAVAGGLDADVERGGGRREECRADKDANDDHREPPAGTAALHPQESSLQNEISLISLDRSLS